MNRERGQGGWTRLSEVDVGHELGQLLLGETPSASDLLDLADDASARATRAPGDPRAGAFLKMAVQLHGAALKQMQTPPADVEPAPAGPALRLVHSNPAKPGRSGATRRDSGLRAVPPPRRRFAR